MVASAQGDDGDLRQCLHQVLMLDFGGVLAEEGFRNGLEAIARSWRISEEEFIAWGYDAVHGTGYVKGKGSEKDFWAELRKKFRIDRTDEELREEILSRFIVRDWMLDLVRRIKLGGVVTALLTDQTDWLYELDRRQGFLCEFDLTLQDNPPEFTFQQ